MTHQPHCVQVQERRLAVVAHPLGGAAGGGVDARQVAAVGADVGQTVAVSVVGVDPALRGFGADADAVVFADEQQRKRKALVGSVNGGVDGTDRGGVIDGRIAETADRDRVGRPRRCDAQFGGSRDGERDPDRAREVGGDRRRLGDDVQVVAAEYFVPPTGDRLLGGRDDPEEHVAQRIASTDLPGPVEEEAARAVMQQCRIGGSKRGRDGSVAFMTRRTDGVEALALRAEPSGCQVQMPAADLGVEQVEQVLRGWMRGSAGRLMLGGPGRGGIGHRGDGGDEVFVYRLGHGRLLLWWDRLLACGGKHVVQFVGIHVVAGGFAGIFRARSHGQVMRAHTMSTSPPAVSR